MIWNFFIFPQAFLKSFTWNNFFANFSRNANFDIFKGFLWFWSWKVRLSKVSSHIWGSKFSKIDIMKDLLFLEWVCVYVDLWHLKNCQKIGSVYFSNFQKIILFKRSVYRVRVSVGPCIFLIPFFFKNSLFL